jgi:gamma-glutamyltranspeptidase/glutathione hydrolase
MMVSWIQSLYTGFGSGLVEPTLGFSLQSRGALFSMEEGHPNVYAPGKRPFHTIMPGMAAQLVTRLPGAPPREGAQGATAVGGGAPWVFSYGVMGGFFQPQGHVQILHNLLVNGLNVQEAGDAARCASPRAPRTQSAARKTSPSHLLSRIPYPIRLPQWQ